MKSINLLYLTLFLSCLSLYRSQVICTAQELLDEYQLDFEQNQKQKVQCKRKIGFGAKQPDRPYTWIGDCAFRTTGLARSNWMHALTAQGIKSLVDENGNEMQPDHWENAFDDEADLCVLLRTLIHSEKGILWDGVSAKDIMCPGGNLGNLDESDKKKQYCAVNMNSFLSDETWYVLLDMTSIRIRDKPYWKRA